MLELDHEDVCPEDTVRAMCSDALGVQLVFVPEEYGGLGGGAFDSYRVCERMARIDLGLATSAFATFLGSDPILMGGTDEQKKDWLGRIAERGDPLRLRGDRAGGGQRPRRDDHRRRTRRRPTARSAGYRITGRKQWISNGTHRRRLHDPRHGSRRPVLVHRREGCTEGFSSRAAGGQARHPAVRHGRAVPRRRHGAGREPGRRRRGARAGAGPAGLRLHPGDGRGLRSGRRLGGDGPRDPLLHPARPGRRPAEREAGLHPQADRPARRAARGGAGGRRGDRHPDRRRRGRRWGAQHRGRHREVPRERGRGGRRRCRDPGARRLRLHPPLHRGEDPARRAHHHDLRGHLRDPGDDDRPGPLAAAPQDPRRPLPRPRPASCAPCTPRIPRSAPTSPRWRSSAWRRPRGLPRRPADPQPARAAAAG